MYPPPQGPNETLEQAEALDDTFLSSDPFAYFISRIAMLHGWALATQKPADEDADADAFPGEVAIGRPDLLGVIHAVMGNQPPPAPPRMATSAQVAVDAFALRHHLAEALLRLFLACADHAERPQQDLAPGTPVSLWARLTDDRNLTIDELVKAAVKAVNRLPEGAFANMVLPPDVPVDETTLPRAERLSAMCADWIEHSVALLRSAQLDTTRAHNKVKHGLAVRGRSDYRLAFSLAPPRPDGDIDLSAFDPDVSVDVFDRPVLEFLARPSRKQGLELTQLRLDYRELLSEGAMMAFVYGALFHVVARSHFADRAIPQGLTVAPHPGFVGETPKPNHAGHQVGLRFPITGPPKGGKARPAGIGHPDGTFQTLIFTGEKTTGRIVDEDPPDAADTMPGEGDFGQDA